MPKGKHKGGRRVFTNFEAQKEEQEQIEKERAWRDTKEQEENSSCSDEEEDSEEEDSDEQSGKVRRPKGVEGLIETRNLNRPSKKTVETVETQAKPELSRRQREELERQKATARYLQKHARGETEEARADLERLAIIRKQREEAAKKKEEAKKDDKYTHQMCKKTETQIRVLGPEGLLNARCSRQLHDYSAERFCDLLTANNNTNPAKEEAVSAKKEAISKVLKKKDKKAG